MKNQYQSYKAIQLKTMILQKKVIEDFKMNFFTKKRYIQLGSTIVVKLDFAYDGGWQKNINYCLTSCVPFYSPKIIVCHVFDFFFLFKIMGQHFKGRKKGGKEN